MRKLMALNPDDRYQTPAELMVALDEVMKTAPTKPGTKAAPVMSSVFARAHESGVQAMVVAPDGAFLLTPLHNGDNP